MQSVPYPVPYDWTTELLQLRRTPGHRSWTGVTKMLSARNGVDPLLIKAFFVLLTASGGLGLIIYLFLVALTYDTVAGRAPLDRFGTGWRKQSSQAIVGGAVALAVVISAIAGMALNTLMGLTSLLIIATMILLGHRTRPHARQPINHALNPIHKRSALAVGLITVVASFLAMLVFAATGTFDLYSVLGIGLLVIAGGLAICAWLGSSKLLIAAGLTLSVLLGLVAFAERMPTSATSETTIGFYSQGELINQDIADSSITYDLTHVVVTSTQTWQVAAFNSSIVFTIPSDQNIQVEIQYQNSTLDLPDSFIFLGSGSYGIRPKTVVSGPMLKVLIVADNSTVTVVQP